jgi:hypothetical protein
MFRGMIVFTVLSALVVTLLLYVLMRDFSWNKRYHLLVVTLFFQMPNRYMVYLAANYIQLMFVCSMLFSSSSVQLSHLIMLVILGIIQAIAIRRPGESIRSLVGCILLYVSFLIVDLLKTYIFEMRFDMRIAFVCGLMYVFLILYTVYFFINSIKCLASRAQIVEKDADVRRRLSRRFKKSGYQVSMVDLDNIESADEEEMAEAQEVGESGETAEVVGMTDVTGEETQDN